MTTFLRNYGKVYLVRLPVHPELQKLEDSLSPDFNVRLAETLQKSNGYLDLTPKNANFNYTDGVHLTSQSGSEVSRLIGEWILHNSEDNSIK
jgi:hypothetical protein